MPDKCRTSAFYVRPRDFDEHGRVVFDQNETNHITRVLRLEPGTLVEVLDGCGGVYEVELAEPRSGLATGRVVSSRQVPPPVPPISAAVALGRKERLRAAAEKLAELGCNRLWPLECGHLQFPGGLERQVDKLQTVAVAALKQSRRPCLMQVEQPVTLAGLLENTDGRMLRPVFCQPAGDGRESSGWDEPVQRQSEYVLVVGPEGGFSEAEHGMIENSGCPRLDLGRWWLRSETAAIAGFTLLAERLWGEFGFFRE